MKKTYKTIIIGAGASGLMLASLLEEKSNVLLIDTNLRIGAKIAISGGGKCNLTNAHVSSDNYLGAEWFVQSVLDRFDQHAVLAWFAQRGLQPQLRKEGQYFCPNSADEVLEVFRRELVDVAMQLGTSVTEVSQTEGGFVVKTDRGAVSSEQLVVASGGLSFSRIGASGIGFEVARCFGHTVRPLAPALVGFTVQKEQFFFKELSGASIPVEITVGEKIFGGDLLFTHKGISGPAVLNASLYWKKGKITIDFLPHFLPASIKGSRKQLSRLLPLPKKVAKRFLTVLNISDKPAVEVSVDAWDKLSILYRYSFAPAGTFGYTKAEVTRGGVACEEIDPYTLMSLKQENLYFIGEVLDVAGELGGYNFQWAFASAYGCAKSLD